MTAVNWTELQTINITPGPIDWPWRVAVETLRDITYLQIESQGSWEAAGNHLKPFSPDGHVGLPIQSDRLILPDCPAGALIGRIGGSSATFATVAVGAAAAESRPFAIGSHCLVPIPSGSVGPLFIGFNWMPRPLTINTLKIIIRGSAPVG